MCSEPALHLMKFAWQAKGIPRNITELEKLVKEPRLPEKIATDKDSYVKNLTGLRIPWRKRNGTQCKNWDYQKLLLILWVRHFSEGKLICQMLRFGKTPCWCWYRVMFKRGIKEEWLAGGYSSVGRTSKRKWWKVVVDIFFYLNWSFK